MKFKYEEKINQQQCLVSVVEILTGMGEFIDFKKNCRTLICKKVW